MATQQQQNAAAFARLSVAINALDAKAALALANAIAALPAAAVIDDAATANNKVWSSNKTQTQITAAITAVINGAGVDSDTLKELADDITALAQADNGLLSAIAVQAFTDPQKQQACANIGIGDPFHDFVPAIEAALNAGL
jgi:type V secretory pathway adhesin AidA